MKPISDIYDRINDLNDILKDEVMPNISPRCNAYDYAVESERVICARTILHWAISNYDMEAIHRKIEEFRRMEGTLERQGLTQTAKRFGIRIRELRWVLED